MESLICHGSIAQDHAMYRHLTVDHVTEFTYFIIKFHHLNAFQMKWLFKNNWNLLAGLLSFKEHHTMWPRKQILPSG